MAEDQFLHPSLASKVLGAQNLATFGGFWPKSGGGEAGPFRRRQSGFLGSNEPFFPKGNLGFGQKWACV